MFKFLAIMTVPAVAMLVVLGLSGMETESEALARMARQDQFISAILK